MTITITPSAIVAITLFILIAIGLRNHFNIGLDDSDRNGSNRSGMEVATDYKTGLQYLLAPGGGVTPRLDAAGRQMMEGER